MRLFTSVSGKSLAPCVHTRKEWSQFLTQSQESRDTNRKVFQWIDYTSNAFIHWPQCTEFMHKSENSTKTTINIWSKKNQPITVIPKQLLQHKVLHLTDMKKASERRWSSQVWNTKNLLYFDFGNKDSQSTVRQLQITEGEKRLA
jgi:hypothetical protein